MNLLQLATESGQIFAALWGGTVNITHFCTYQQRLLVQKVD
jgi:hypothetical protein